MNRKRKNVIVDGWKVTLANALHNSMLMDTPLGKTNFAGGASCVLAWLRDHPNDWERLHADLEAFIRAYMADSERMMASPAYQRHEELLRKWGMRP